MDSGLEDSARGHRRAARGLPDGLGDWSSCREGESGWIQEVGVEMG